MSQAHAFVGLVAVALALIAAVWSIGLALTRRTGGALFIGNLIWVVAIVAIAALLGVAAAATVGPPGDPLHIVYGIIAVAVLPGAALVASGRSAREQSIVAAVATTVLLIILFRLVQTGS